MFRLKPSVMLGVFVAALLCPGSAWGSGANFVLRGEGVELGEAKEIYVTDADGKQAPLPPRYEIKLEQGRPFTLVAQAVVLPRGGRSTPYEPGAGAWLFDDEQLQLLPHDKKRYDKTMIAIRLKALKAGQTRIRFVGDVLGYYHRFDVLVNVAAPKK